MTSTMVRTPDPVTAGEQVIASFRSAREACLAVDHLRDQGFEDVAITAHDPVLEAPDASTPGRRWVPALAVAGVATASAWAAAALAGAVPTGRAALVAVVLGALTAALVTEWRRARRLRRDHDPQLLPAGRFDVVCRRRARAAGHALARWWRPDARPIAR